MQIPSTKKAGQISPVPTWALNTIFVGDLQGGMGVRIANDVQRLASLFIRQTRGKASSSQTQESGKAVVSLMSSITKLAEISEIEILAIRR